MPVILVPNQSAATNSRSDLLRKLSRALFREDWISFTPLVNTDNTTLVVPATELRDTDASAHTYDGGWLYVDSGTGAGSERRVSIYQPQGGSSYGTITLTRALDVALDRTSTCFLYTGPLSPSDLLDILNRSLRTLRHPRTIPLTLVEDGTMEAADVTAWTPQNAILTKIAGANDVREGAQALQVANTVANGGALATDIDVIPGERLFAEAVVRLKNTTDVGGPHTATFAAYDLTNGANIQTAFTAGRARTRLRLDLTIPPGCFQLQFQLLGSAASTIGAWDEVVAWRPNDRQFPLPFDITRFDQLVRVWQRQVWAASASGEQGAEAPYAVDVTQIDGFNLLADPTASTPYVLDLGGSNWRTPNAVLIECLLPWAELTTDDQTTACPLDDVLLRARGYAYAQLAKDGPHDDRDYYKALAQEFGAVKAAQAAFDPRPARPVSSRSNQTHRYAGAHRGW